MHINDQFMALKSRRKWSGWSGRYPFTVALLMLLITLWCAPAGAVPPHVGAGAGLDLQASSAGMMSPSISMAPEAYHLDLLGSASGGDAIITVAHAEIGKMSARILARRNSGALTRGYEKKLKIAVPKKQGFNAFVNATNQKVTGYCIDVFEAAVKKLPHVLDYEFYVFSGSYDQLVRHVSSGIFDAAVGDVTITAERVSHVDFTMPYTESGVSLLVLTENDSKPTIEWVFLKPLTTELWLATLGGFFFTGLVVWMIEQPRNLEYQGSSSRQFSTALYFSFSTLTFSHGQIIKSSLSKIVVVIWCFVVLVLVQSYTASLSSILTAKRLRPSVTDLDQLLLNGDYVGYQSGSFVHSVLTNEGFPGEKLRPYTKKEEYAKALRKGSNNGGVSAIVDKIPYITSFLTDARYQNEFQMVNCIYKTPGLGFVLPQGSPLVHNLSIAILELTGGDEGSLIEAKWLGTAAPLPSYGVPNTDSTPLTLRSFSGLFIITSADGDGGGEGHGESSAVQNGMGNGSLTDQPHHEARRDDHRGILRSDESACDEEPSAMQNNGSVPAHSIQIEMNTG